MIRVQNTFSGTQEGWRARAAHLRALRDEYDRNWTIMTPYEQQKALEAIAAAHRANEPTIKAGALQEWNASVETLRERLRAVDVARALEIARWSPAKLRDEMQVAAMLADNAIAAGDYDRLNEIFQEAKQSGDEYKIRAACETMRGALGKVPNADLETRMKVNRLKSQAEQDLAGLRTTQKLQDAHAAASQAVENIRQARETLYEAAAALGKIAPNEQLTDDTFINALMRVETDDRGNIIRIK